MPNYCVTHYIKQTFQSLWNSGDEFNILKVYAKMADLQRQESAFNYGVYEEVIVTDDVFSFMRHYDGTDRYTNSCPSSLYVYRLRAELLSQFLS